MNKQHLPDRLVSMTDYVLELERKYLDDTDNYDPMEIVQLSIPYAHLLKQPLTLSMFIPVDEEGNVLERPYELDYKDNPSEWEVLFTKWKEAESNVVFEGFELIKSYWLDGQTEYRVSIGELNLFNGFTRSENVPLLKQVYNFKTIENLVTFNIKIKKLWN